MVQKYIVVNPFGNAKKDDIFELDGNVYNMIAESSAYKEGMSCTSHRSMLIDKDSIESYVKEGYLLEYQAEANTEVQRTSDEKLDEIQQKIDELRIAYLSKNDMINTAYDNKEIPACVKVEANTVHFNLIKLLNEFQAIIDKA